MPDPPRSIHPALRTLTPSATLALQARCKAMPGPVFNLGLGQSPFPVPAPVVDALVAHAGAKDYLPVRGLPALREAVARDHRDRLGAPATADDVLIGPGSKALLFGLQLAADLDLILPAPSWVSYAPQAQLLGRAVHWIGTDRRDGWRLDPAALAAACPAERQAILVLNTPNNPVGNGYSADRLEAIAAVARDRGLIVLSDEIYGELHHRGEHASIAAIWPEGTVVSGGLSKWCGAGGWRLGTLVFGPSLGWLAEATAVVASETFSATSAPIQHAAVAAYDGHPEIAAYLARSRAIVGALARWAVGRLRRAGCFCPEPEGAFYLMCDLGGDGAQTAAELCEQLLVQQGVAALPGSDFGLPAQEPVVRFALVDFDGAAALSAAATAPVDEAFLRTYCPNVVEGIERVAEWAEVRR